MNQCVFPVKRIVPLTFLLLLTSTRSEVNDDELWAAVEFSKEITSKLELELGQELRLKKYFSEFHKTFTDLSLSYTIFSSIKVSGEYRYIVYGDKEKSRISLGGKFDFKFLNLMPSHRLKLQQETEKGEVPDELELRNKFKIEYPLSKRFTPFVSYELFQVQEDEYYTSDKYRAGVGIEFDLNESYSFELFYIFEEELNKSVNERTNIFGLKYEIDII